MAHGKMISCDEGICYNILINEIDSVWPKSIECPSAGGGCG